MTRLSTRPAFSIQRGMTLIELMIGMLLGLIVVGGVLGIFIANSEAHRRTDDLARIQENARVAIQLMSRSMREAGGNPCGLPPDKGLIFHSAEVPTSNWWSGGNDFRSAFVGFANGSQFPISGSVTGSDAVITISGNAFVKTVTGDNPPDGVMHISANRGLANNDILFACSTDRGYGVVFRTTGVSGSGTNWSISRATPFNGAVAGMKATALGKINAEGWFVGNNGRGGTSLFRAFIGDNGQPEEIAPDVSAMRITYLLPNANQYVAANQIDVGDWPNIVAAYIELTLARNAANQTTLQRTVGLTVNLRNRFDWNLNRGNSNEGNQP
jgi:type IV pilus assembly protein PilW